MTATQSKAQTTDYNNQRRIGSHKTINPRRGDKPLLVPAGPDDTNEVALARTVLRPTVNAAVTIRGFSSYVAGVALDLNALISELSDQCASATSGNLGRSEAMLVAHANTLDAIFNNLAMRANTNSGYDPDKTDRYFRLALKAQNQCRATLETLANLKNPPVVIARKANVTSGPQQINNGITQESQSMQGKLLEQGDGERLDPGATG